MSDDRRSTASSSAAGASAGAEKGAEASRTTGTDRASGSDRPEADTTAAATSFEDMSPVQRAIQTWKVDHIFNSPMSADTPAYNHLSEALGKLPAYIERELGQK